MKNTIKKVIILLAIILGLFNFSNLYADYSPTSVPASIWSYQGDPQWYFSAFYPGDITSEDLWLWRGGSTYNDIGLELCDIAYNYMYDSFFNETYIVCQSTSFIGAGDWGVLTGENIVQYTAPAVVDPCLSYGGSGISNIVDNIGCQITENSKLVSENTIGQIFFYLIGIFLFSVIAIIFIMIIKGKKHR